MKTVKVKDIKKGDIVLIGERLEVCTENDTLFYSAPILSQDHFNYNEPFYSDPLRRSSHWVGDLGDEDEVIIFNDIEEAILHIKFELKNLSNYYEL